MFKSARLTLPLRDIIENRPAKGHAQVDMVAGSHDGCAARHQR